MYDGWIAGFMVTMLLVAIGVNLLQIVRGIIKWYRITSYVASRANVTVSELQKMLEGRRMPHARPQLKG
jgi:hypothetical protein